MAGFIRVFAALAYLVAVALITRLIVTHGLPRVVRRWAWLPIAAIVAVLPFVDEIYNARQTLLACEAEGGVSIRKQISAVSSDEAFALIQMRKLDSEEPYFWQHELLFVDRETGDELARLKWFERKHGWLQGNEPGSSYAGIFKAMPCPDPQPYLVGGAMRQRLIKRWTSMAAPSF